MLDGWDAVGRLGKFMGPVINLIDRRSESERKKRVLVHFENLVIDEYVLLSAFLRRCNVEPLHYCV